MNLFESVTRAQNIIAPYVHETALEQSLALSERADASIFLKCEHQQRTGSFKFRGALHKILTLNDVEKRQGVVAASTGNHGMGVALAAQIVNIKATIYVPASASPMKLKSIEALGAQIEICEGDCLGAEMIARSVAVKTDRVFISPYNDAQVIAGQGTIGAELFQQNKNLDAVFISVGGGGLISGIAGYLKQANPNIKIVGCWPENAPAMYECLKKGAIVDVPEQPTLSDATAGGVEPGAQTFEYCRSLIDDCVLVSESEIADAMRIVAEQERWIIEGAAGVAVAACLKTATKYKKQTLAVVLCGGNIILEKFNQAIA